VEYTVNSVRHSWRAMGGSDHTTVRYTVGELTAGAAHSFTIRAVAGTGGDAIQSAASNAAVATPSGEATLKAPPASPPQQDRKGTR